MINPFDEAKNVLGREPGLRDPALEGEHTLKLQSLGFVKDFVVKATFSVVSSDNKKMLEFQKDKTNVAIVFKMGEYVASYLRDVGNLVGAVTGKHASRFQDGKLLEKVIGTAEFEGKSVVGNEVTSTIAMITSKRTGKESPRASFS